MKITIHGEGGEWVEGTLFRRCSICRSMHPEDLLYALSNDAYLDAADWSDWPRKLYVHHIPNSEWDRTTIVASTLIDLKNGRQKLIMFEGLEGMGHGMFNNEHLMDCDPDLFNRLQHSIWKAAHLWFALDPDGNLRFRAPSQGYRRRGPATEARLGPELSAEDLDALRLEV